MAQIVISDRVLGVLDALKPDTTVETQIAHLAEGQLRRRLARYQLQNRLFEEKYGMSLAEFEAREMVKQRNYSFEVESDHQDWDLAIDGIRTIERQLIELWGTGGCQGDVVVYLKEMTFTYLCYCHGFDHPPGRSHHPPDKFIHNTTMMEK